MAGEAREVTLEVGLHHADQRLRGARRPDARSGLVGHVVIIRNAVRHGRGRAQKGVGKGTGAAAADALLLQHRLALGGQSRPARENQRAALRQVVAQRRAQGLVHGGGLRHQHQLVAVERGVRRHHVELLPELLQRAGSAQTGGAGIVAQLRVHQQRDLAEHGAAGNERFARLEVGVHPADQVVYRRLRDPARVQQIADAGRHALAQRLATLILQRRRRLEAGVVAPALEEAPGVGQGRQAEGADEARHVGEVGVAPAAGGQRLDLHPAQELLLHLQVGLGARVEPDAEVVGARARGLHHGAEAAHVVERDLPGVARPVLGQARVQVAPRHPLQRPPGHARLIPAHVEEDAVHRAVEVQDLLDLLRQVLLVGTRHVQHLPARVQRRALVAGPVARQVLDPAAVGIDGHPLGMRVGGVLVDLAGNVDRRAQAGAAQRLDLGAGQVQAGGQVGVPAGMAGAIVGVPVMAGGEHRDAVHVSILEGLREALGGEVPRHVRDLRSGVEVEVDGAQREGEVGHGPEPTRPRARPASASPRSGASFLRRRRRFALRPAAAG